MENLSGTSLTILSILFFAASILFALLKSALVNLSHTRFEEMQETEEAKQTAYRFLSKSSKIFITITLMNTTCNIAFVSCVILFFAENETIRCSKFLYALIGAFIPMLIFAKAIPESLGRERSEQVMHRFFFFIKAVYYLFFWVIWPLYCLTRLCEKIFRPSPVAPSAAAIEKEVLNAVSEGEKEGVFHETEKDMIRGIMQLKDSEVKEVMTPRIDMVSISVEAPLNKALSLAIETGHSRIPLYKENRDDIVGTLYIKDFLKYWDDPNRNSLSLAKLARKPYFVPETKHIGALLRDFQKQKLHMAIVLDEYGGTAGIITVEDIVEEIVGEILDEYDLDILEPIRHVEDNIVEVDARIHVDELNKTLNVNLPLDVGYDTIGGFIFGSMGRIPAKGETYHYDNLEFTILEATTRRIDRIKVIKKQDE